MKYRFQMSVPGATEEQLKRGFDAAMQVFREKDVDPVFAACSHFKREGWDVSGNSTRAPSDDFVDEYEPTDKEMDAAEVWEQAQDAALAACCEGWGSIPADAGGFEMVPVEQDPPENLATA
jgi:hypothetical protein